MEKKETISILAFGDSLTCGWSNFGTEHFPYGINLHKLLTEKYPEKNFEIQVSGISGQKAFGMPPRMKEEIKEKEYHYVIILAGTNDLSQSYSAEEIFEQISSLHEIALKSDSVRKTIAITIPQAAADSHFKDYLEKKLQINSLIQKLVDSNQKIELVDLYSLIPFSSPSENQKDSLWNDSLHFSSIGYDKMGELIFNVFVEKIFN
ncbi:hypothetical protein M0811_10705 [Anaeramoeba ignava]|uniref:SGNH hydrolase-type esterase domain-containing protein n=1 Tax=Anaeramoeba ignava TaxID=1746090 RepID=A0A9Q0LEY3_ANAIG|nr:hypothetical protein M0811_10705 [Anaeramoeba ignava]